ncbi:MAG TPA: hypothetical protein PKE45_04430 [Caldilineaceae bacterium]|nr:hypothetical protein [Caldilineaceae bacterium]
MAETLRLFVSATADLEAERALIGRAVAELPIQIGVEIRRTPARGATYEDIFELIGNVDRVYFLIGEDITAPSGAEWFLAWKLERSILPLRHEGRPTPAAQDFLRLYPGQWVTFRTGVELIRLVTLDLARILHHPTNRYGLSVTELELLNLHVRRLENGRSEQAWEPGGAEGGGILLDLGHREPVEGIALGE